MISEHQPNWDAETLMEAERIKADKSRLSAAQSAAKEMAERKSSEANAMRKVAGKPKGQKTTVKSSAGTTDGTSSAPRSQKTNQFNVFQRI